MSAVEKYIKQREASNPWTIREVRIVHAADAAIAELEADLETCDVKLANLRAEMESLKCCGNCKHRRRYACQADPYNIFHWPEGKCAYTPSRWAKRGET